MRRPSALLRFLYQFLLRLLTPIGFLLMQVRFRGLNCIPKKGPYIICANHRSVLDPFFIAMGFLQHLYFMAKSELFTDHGPLIAWLLRSMGAFPVRRDSADLQSLRQAEAVLRRGDILAIFSQGRVVFDNAPFRPKAGAVLLAARTGVPILPVAVWCEGPWQVGKKVTIRIGKLIDAQRFAGADGNRKQLHAAATLLADTINELLKKEHGA